MAIAPFPHTYSVSLEGGELAADPRLPIRAGTPPQFGGSDDVWSPEHLLVSAALLCLKTTFDAYARRERLTIRKWSGTATGTLAKAKVGPVFTAIDLDVDIETDAGEEARVLATLVTAERDCIITRALSAPVRLTSRVIAPPTRAAG